MKGMIHIYVYIYLIYKIIIDTEHHRSFLIPLSCYLLFNSISNIVIKKMIKYMVGLKILE